MKMIVICVTWTIIGAALHSVWSEWGKRRALDHKTGLYQATCEPRVIHLLGAWVEAR